MIGLRVKDRPHGLATRSEHRCVAVCSLLTRHSGRLSTDRCCLYRIACAHNTATKVPPKVVLAPTDSACTPTKLTHWWWTAHSLASTAPLTECSIEYSIGLLPIFHTVQSNRMPSHIWHVSQPPRSICTPPPPLRQVYPSAAAKANALVHHPLGHTP